MAQDNSGALVGCGLLLAWLVLAFWPLVLLTLVVVLVAGLVLYAIALVRFADLRQIAAAAQRRFKGEVCVVEGCYGVVRDLVLEGPATDPHLCLSLDLLESGASGPLLCSQQQQLNPPAQLAGLRSNSGLARFLESRGVTLVAELSVEARATRAALDCARERSWSQEALATLQQLRRSAATTLAKASGNELLEPSIPQLQQALAAFNAEERKLQQALTEATTMLAKLHDFLSVPAGLRPILSFDLDGLFDPQRLQALEQSFAEVVQLNEAFRDLSRPRFD